MTKIKDYQKNYISSIGKPTIIQSYNGGEFTSKLFKNFLNENWIKLINSSAYHPQTNGSVEAFNKNIVIKLEKILKENKKLSINKALEKAINASNNSILLQVK